jgi:hypothetical protein
MRTTPQNLPLPILTSEQQCRWHCLLPYFHSLHSLPKHSASPTMAPQPVHPFMPSYHDLPALSRRFLPPTNSTTLQNHIQVYAIPYGVLGFLSHTLTFYVILCHLFGRRPLLPWQALQKTTWNIVLVSLSSLISVILSIVTLARTRGSQPLMILAAMQIVLGVLVDAVHIHRLVVKCEGWSNGLGAWGMPMVATGIFSVWAFYQFPCE